MNGVPVDAHGPADHRVRSAEAPLPAIVAQHRVGIAARRRRAREKPAEHRPHAQHVEIVLAHHLAPHEIASHAGAQTQRYTDVYGQPVEDPTRLGKVAKVIVRERAELAAVPVRGVERDETIRTVARNGAEEQTVDGAEHGAIDAHADRKNECRGDHETRTPPERSHGVSHIRPDISQPPFPALVTHRFAVCIHPAEGDERRSASTLAAHTAAHVLRRLHLEVETEFLVHAGFARATVEQVADPRPEAEERAHAASVRPRAARGRPPPRTAASSRFLGRARDDPRR